MRITTSREMYIPQTEEKSKTVEECCDGYKKLVTHDDADAKCLPFCEKCLAGKCVAPNECQCNPGYQGDDCARGKTNITSIARRILRCSHIYTRCTRYYAIFVS